MRSEFKAIVLANEINITKIAQHFGILRKFRWEESLLLKGTDLQGIITIPENKLIYIFHFGSAVFVNFHHHEMMDIVKYFNKIDPEFNISIPFKYVDDYRIEINSDEPLAINNDFMVTDQEGEFHLEIVSTILAKSVALERIEAEIDRLLDEIEIVLNDLYQGHLAASDEKMAQMAARILSFKLSSISYIMLLDKPDITWNNEDASSLYDELSTLFELDDRYEKIRHKTDTLMNITEVFSGLAHAKRGNRLEWMVIILITIEIILSLIEMFLR